MERWCGRVALVTGASAGIGFALSETLAKHGLKVVGCARNIEKIQVLSSTLSSSGCQGLVRAIRCDVTKEDQILAMFAAIKEEFGGVDICVNNAGLAHDAPLISGEASLFRSMLEVNVLGLSICTREAIKSMKDRSVDDGHIQHVSSMSGHRVPQGSSGGFYCATKFAVRALTEGLRSELRAMNSNIRITCVSPGVVQTEFAIRAKGEEHGKQLYANNPALNAQDVVDAIIYQLAAPPHVQVHDILVRPTGQKS